MGRLELCRFKASPLIQFSLQGHGTETRVGTVTFLQEKDGALLCIGVCHSQIQQRSVYCCHLATMKRYKQCGGGEGQGTGHGGAE